MRMMVLLKNRRASMPPLSKAYRLRGGLQGTSGTCVSGDGGLPQNGWKDPRSCCDHRDCGTWIIDGRSKAAGRAGDEIMTRYAGDIGPGHHRRQKLIWNEEPEYR
jgi:hypothetical protein